MWSQIQEWVNTSIDAPVTWLSQLGDGIGFPLWGFLVACTILCIVLAYLVIPAVGKSDSGLEQKGNDWYMEYRRNKH